MGLVDLFKKKGSGIVLGAPMKGKCVSIHEVPDPTFGEEILGKGIAIIPSDGRVYAPADGVISTVFPTGHALGMTAGDVELLIHIGLDTVELNGEPFPIRVSAAKAVKKGDLLIEADLEKIRAAGKNILTPMVECKYAPWSETKCSSVREVEPWDAGMRMT